MHLSFIGDIMLGRNVAAKYSEEPYKIISEEVLSKINTSDICVANLESPITTIGEDDSLKFSGNPDTLAHFKWVDCFSLSNNHINDFGSQGMSDTIKNLKDAKILFNGLFEGQYEPYKIEHQGEKIAVIMCTDMMNIEFVSSCPYMTLRVNKPQEIADIILSSKAQGFFTILYAHIGMLFSRFPNPLSREFLHGMVDVGADCIVTAHSHCLGCHEVYKGVHIFHSLGDFLMDGSSFRRRTACILTLSIKNNTLENWSIQPTQTTMNLQVVFPEEKVAKKIIRQYEKNSKKLSNARGNYKAFYKRQYRYDMFAHSFSTLHFELKRRGVKGLFHILRVRFRDVFGMIKRVFTDRSNMAYDTDGVDNKHIISNKDIQLI